MSDIKNEILINLEQLGFTAPEALVYYELTRRGSLTHLQISRLTGISRTKVYRIVETLSSKGVVAKKSDDDGSAIVANGPEALGLELANESELLNKRQAAFERAQSQLLGLINQGRQELKFTLRTYDGVDGFKQMLWNELKTKGELLAFGDGTLEDLVGSRAWAEKQRQLNVEHSYSIREIANKPIIPTNNEAFTDKIAARKIDKSILPLQHQIIVYNDTVSIYCWRDGQKTGVEIINEAFAQTMRSVFERYWELAITPVEGTQ